MKILKLLNKRNLSILISFFFLQNSFSTEPVDIWKIENQTSEDIIVNSEIIDNANIIFVLYPSPYFLQFCQKSNIVHKLFHSRHLVPPHFLYIKVRYINLIIKIP